MEFGAATATLSKKLSNGYGVSGRSAYDGVFAAPVKLRAPSFSSRLEDYCEVFGSSGASSIPILELPELNERKQNDDVRRSKFDYSKVFGGFGNLETATPLEELIAEPKQNQKDSSITGVSIRTEAKGGNQSRREDPTNYSKESSMVSRSSIDTKKINMSYHKFNQGSENGTNGTTRVGQLHAVPAYTCVVKEVNPVKVNKVNKLPVAQDAYSGIHCNEGIKDGGHCTKSFTGPSPDNAKKQSSKNGVKVKNRSDSIDLFFGACEVSNGSNGTHQVKVPPSETMVGNLDNHNGEAMKSMATKSQASKSKKTEGAAGENQSSKNGVKVKNRSDSIDLFFDACEISNGSNGTNHIKVPPSETVAGNLDIHNGHAVGSMATKSQASESDRSVGAAGADSPSYLDDMVDSNSEAAASVAALRKAIEEAQVRMKVAKESMRRKKEGFPDRVKRKSNIDLKAERIKEDKNAYKTMNLEEINTRQTFGEMDAFPQVSSDVGKATTRIEQVRSDIGAKEMFVAEEAVREALKKLKSTQAEHKEEVEQKADDNTKVLEIKEVENNKEELRTENMGGSASEKLEECDHTIEVVKEEQENNKEKVSAANKAGACEELVDESRHTCQEVVDETKLVQKTLDNGTTDKRLKANGDGEVEKVSPFHESDSDCRSNLSEQGSVIEDENKVDGKEIEGSFELEDCQRNFRAIQELREVENFAQEQKGSEEKVDVSSELEECELPESLKPMDSKGACSPHGSGLKILEREKENLGCLEDRKRGNEAGFVDVNCETEHSCQRDGTENTFSNVYVQEILEEIVDHIHDKEEIYSRITKDSELDGYERVQDSKASRNELEGAIHLMEESERERKDNKEPVEVIRVTQTDTNYEEIQAEEAGKTTETSSSYEPTEKLSKTQVSDFTIENDEALEATPEVYSHDLLDDIMVASDDASFEHQEKYDKPESVQETNDFRKKHTVETFAFMQSTLELNEAVNQMQNTSETVTFEGAAPNIVETDIKVRQNQDQCVEKPENDCNLEMLSEEIIPKSVEILKDAKEAGVTLDEEIDENRSNSSNEENSFHNEHNTEASQIPTMSERKSSSFKEEEVKTIHSNLEENHQAALAMEEKESNEAGVTLDEEIDENRSNSSNEENSFHNEHNTEASQIPTMSERKSSSFKEEEVKTIHSNLEENHQAALTLEEKESNGNLQKVELEKEVVKKIDDAKGREREREKEKLAVERAIREARYRAFAEARERAALERAAAEARQKNISNGREGLGKTTGQANGKTAAEKAAMEAKLKAERAAVERATAEVRARALERALSEKAASEARNKSDKSVAEQLFGASRDNGMKQNFHSKSFSYGVRDSTDVFDGDSAERCKARSERHQRIGERVAKALAEKNLHDRLVQKEQVERNRIAEALDADVKRWSSGKAGNLRALLSTLQYILGPDSGWQPIPLTDMVANTAVKKAYRKATLFVHPDKLQQRGASIKQKYTCEKVFDLLKEAWNRFNMEER